MASRQRMTLTILSGATASEEMTEDNLRNCRELSIQAPSTLTGTISLQSGSLNAAGALVYAVVQSPPGTDITFAADKTTVLMATPFGRARLLSSLAEGADRIFYVWLTIGE